MLVTVISAEIARMAQQHRKQASRVVISDDCHGASGIGSGVCLTCRLHKYGNQIAIDESISWLENGVQASKQFCDFQFDCNDYVDREALANRFHLTLNPRG